MTGSTPNQNVIAGNLLVALRTQLRGSGCRVFLVGMKLRIEASNAFYYPDVVVTCDDRDRPNNEQYISYPRLIIEVLSPSTARFDRTEKFADYRTIPSLTEYVLVSTDCQAIEVFQKSDRGEWQRANPSDPVQLISINASIAIADIYEDTDLAG